MRRSANLGASMNSDIWHSIMSAQAGPFTLQELLISFGLVLLTLFLRGIIARTIFSSLKRLANRTRWEYDDRFLDALEKPTSSFILVAGIYLATVVLPLQDEWQSLIQTIFRGVSIVIVFWGLFRLADVLVDVLEQVSSNTDNDAFRGFGSLVKKSLRIFIIIVGVVMVIDNLGYDIGGIIATLGIGGAAFAFAAKDTIANLYGSIALALDRHLIAEERAVVETLHLVCAARL